MPGSRIFALLILIPFLGVLFTTAAAAQELQRRGRGRRQQVSGLVRDDTTHEGLNNVELDLRSRAKAGTLTEQS